MSDIILPPLRASSLATERIKSPITTRRPAKHSPGEVQPSRNLFVRVIRKANSLASPQYDEHHQGTASRRDHVRRRDEEKKQILAARMGNVGCW